MRLFESIQDIILIFSPRRLCFNEVEARRR